MFQVRRTKKRARLKLTVMFYGRQPQGKSMLKFLKNLFKSSSKEPEIKVSAGVIVNNEVNPAREMLKEATALKKEKKYDEACDKLKEAFRAKGSDELMVKERMRLPMYLQLAKKNDEGWGILNELNIKYTDVFSQAEIANQMRVFLEKEKKYKQALLFVVWSTCKEIERDRSNIQNSIDFADQMSETEKEYGSLFDKSNEKVFGKTPKGNPITDSAYQMFIDRVKGSMSKEGIFGRIQALLKKLKQLELADPISEDISEYLHSKERYELQTVRDILNEKLRDENASV